MKPPSATVDKIEQNMKLSIELGFSVPIIPIIPWIGFLQYQCLPMLAIADNNMMSVNMLPPIMITINQLYNTPLIILSIVNYHSGKSED